MPPLNLVLKQTSPLYNEDPTGAPLPLGRRQYDAGTIEMLGDQIGEYLRIKEVHAVTLNTAAVTMTLFFPAATPVPITLQGSHSFSSGDELGSINASGVPGITGILFSFHGATNVLTLHFP
jgi:hypothetical protein